MITQKCDILSLSPDELKEYLLAMDEPAYRAAQIFAWLHKGASFEEMTNIPSSLRAKLSETSEYRMPKIKKKLVSSVDGTVKYLFEMIDGECIESVFMRYEHGNTVCVSSQAGCRMGCRFCASAVSGFSRNLTPSEMLGQVIIASKDSGERVSGIVIMGIGEPLDNYGNVIKFLRLAGAPGGLCVGLRHISLSTCGLAERIKDLAGEGLPVTLSVSLHSPDDKERSEIMPVNNKWNIEKLLRACRYYFDKTGRRVSFEYTLIAGKNDSPENALALSSLLKKYGQTGAHINLIPLNPVSESVFSPPDRKSAEIFSGKLKSLGINSTVRRKLGSDINASCGQLRKNSGNLSLKENN